MAEAVRKTGLLNKMGARLAKAHEAHKGDETKFGIIELPPGIKNGRARLVMAKLDTHAEGDNKGKTYAVFRGIAITPDTHNGQKVKGQGVVKSITLDDVTRGKGTDNEKTVTFEENYAEFLNELRKLDVDTTKMAANGTAVDTILLLLEKQKPVFKFSTRGWTPPASQRDPNPKEMVFTQFDGIDKEFTEEATDPGAGFTEAASGGAGEDGSGDTGTETGGEDAPDLAALCASADEGDEAAANKAHGIAMKAGVTQEEFDATPWSDMQALIESKISGELEESDPEPPPAPKVNQQFKYVVKKGGKPQDVKVVKVDSKAGTCDLLSLVDRKTTYKGVAFDSLLKS